MRRRWKGASVALVAVVALGAGCSSSDGGSGGGASSTTAPSGTSAPASSTTTKGTAPSATEAPASGDASATAKAALIEASDLGSDWKMDAGAASPTSLSETFLAIPACAALVPDAGSGATAEGSAQAEYTTTGSTLSVQYQVDIYPTEEDAAAIISLFESADFASCLEAALSQESTGTTISAVTASSLTIPSAADLGVDAAAGIQANAAIADAGGSNGSIQVQVVLLRQGSALGVFTVTQAALGGTPPAIEVNEDTVRAAAAKLAST